MGSVTDGKHLRLQPLMSPMVLDAILKVSSVEQQCNLSSSFLALALLDLSFAGWVLGCVAWYRLCVISSKAANC